MGLAIGIVSALLVLSIALNLFLLFKTKQKLKRQETYDAVALLHDLTGGEAIIKITRIAPGDVFLRSPRT